MNQLVYKAKWYPFGPIFAMVVCIVVILGQDVSGFTGGSINWAGVAATYIGIPLFILVWLGYKFICKTRVVPLTECNLEREIDS